MTQFYSNMEDREVVARGEAVVLEEYQGIMIEEEKESPIEVLLRQIPNQVEVKDDDQVPDQYDSLQIHDQFQEVYAKHEPLAPGKEVQQI